jgi:amidase
MAANRLDAIVAPTIETPWTIDLLNGETVDFGSTGPSQAAGWPSITVPAGYAGEVPIGVSFMAREWEEPKLIRCTFAFEQHTRARHAPTFLDGYGVKDFIPR